MSGLKKPLKEKKRKHGDKLMSYTKKYMLEKANKASFVFLLFAISVPTHLVNGQPVESPPIPDFKKQIDYIQWCQKQLAFANGDNASIVYSTFFHKPGDSSWNFLKPTEQAADQIDTIISNSQMWEPNEFRNVEEYLRSIETYMDAYEIGSSSYKYFSIPIEIDKKFEDTLFIRLPHIGNSQLLSNAMLALAWRKYNGIFCIGEFNEKVLIILRHSNHIQQGLSLVEQRVAIYEKDLAYTAILSAINRNLFDSTSLSNLHCFLDQNNVTDTRNSLIRSTPFEQAASLALLQSMCKPFPYFGKPRLNKNKVRKWWELFGRSYKYGSTNLLQKVLAEDPVKLSHQIKSYYTENSDIISGKCKVNYESSFSQLSKKYTSIHPYFRAFPFANFSKSYGKCIEVERKRRIMHLAVRLLVYRNKNKLFPQKLSLLLNNGDTSIIIDPVTNSPFEYCSEESRASVKGLGVGIFSDIIVQLGKKSMENGQD